MIDNMIEEILKFDESQIEKKYREYLKCVRPMTSAGILQIINKTCHHISQGNCYLEVGTHRGSTLIGASLDVSPSIPFYGIDPFTGHNSPVECAPFNSIEEGLQDAIAKLTAGNVSYFKEPFESFLHDKSHIEGNKIEVYLYDGDHALAPTLQGLEMIRPLLSDDAIIFVDDTANNDKAAIWGALEIFLKDEPRVSVLREFIPTKTMPDTEGLWCGLVALRWLNDKNK